MKYRPVKYCLPLTDDDQARLRAIYRIADKLPERKRMIFYCHYKDGKTLSEIAKEYNISRERVRQIISNCVQYIRMHIGGDHV